jgi:AraC-like DNA-binding protein
MATAAQHTRSGRAGRAFPRSRGSVAARLVAGIAAAGEARGVDTLAALREAGIEPELLDDPEARVAIEREEVLWDELARRSGDPCFGLHAQLHIPAGAIDVVDYEVRASATLGDALENLVRHNRLIHDLAEFELRSESGTTRIVQRFRGDPRGPSWQVADYSAGGLVIVMRQLVGEVFTPREVRIAHAHPDDLAPYVRLFGIEPVFGSATTEIAFDSVLLTRPVVTADPRLHDVLRRHAETLLERLLGEGPLLADDLAGQVRELVARALCRGDVRIETIAAQLAIGPRTLQRRLADAGTSHQRLLDALREEMAADLLREKRASIAEVARLLGYSEASAFHRAFKRWHGETPSEFRRRLP